MGERTSMRRTDHRKQMLHGFRPTDDEVRSLSQFGDITYVGDVISTKVCIRNVARKDIAQIAALPSVVEVSVQPDSVNLVEASGCNGVNNPVDVSEIVGNSWNQFTSAHGNYNAYFVDIGIVDTGYDTTYGSYASNYANDIGFNRSLSKDFTTESDPFSDSSFGGHGTDDADTAAYMLKDGDTHSDMFVSLKVLASGTSSNNNFDENVRQAIEYATKNGIDVLSVPLDTTDGPFSKCPSTYCSELDSYTNGGGVPVVSVDNSDETSAVEHPACSWLTVGVGGVQKKQNDGDVVEHPTDSQYGDILFYDPFNDTTYCPWCYNASGVSISFSPEVYGVWPVRTDAGQCYAGTSAATPQVAAAAWINFADGGIDSYSSAVNKFKNMGEYKVVNDDEDSDPSAEGDLVEADYYF